MSAAPSHQPISPVTDARARLLGTAVVMIWILLAARLIQLQGIDHAKLAWQANRQRSVVEIVLARPGEILDRTGRSMAITVAAHSLYVVPSQVVAPQQTAMSLARALSVDTAQLEHRLRVNRRKHFLWIKRRLTEAQVRRVRDLRLPSGTWGFRKEYQRRYPQGSLAAHILGLRDIDGRGRGGVEQALDSVLRGRNGRRVLIRDAHGDVIEVQNDLQQAPRPGRNVVLTIDAVIQLNAERELDAVMAKWKPRGACVTVLDPRNGEILAMASRPTFDPNRPDRVSQDAWMNRNITMMYEPGSTFKPFVVAWAIDQHVIARDEQFDCERGQWRMGRRILHDHHPYGTLSVHDILVKSSNIGMAKIGSRLSNAGLYAAAAAFGFGGKTGLGLPGEQSGMLRPLTKWNGYSTGSIPMGQEIAVTPLQLIAAHAVLAGDGRLLSPQLVLRHGDADRSYGRKSTTKPCRAGSRLPICSDGSTTAGGSLPYGTVVSRVISAKTARWIVTGPLSDVVRRGTGKRARLADYTVFGKTGTAQKLDPKTGRYSKSKYVSSFLCGAPADKPRVLVLVVVDEPSVGGTHYGGTVAAPTAARILHKTLMHLRIPPDRVAVRRTREQFTR